MALTRENFKTVRRRIVGLAVWERRGAWRPGRRPHCLYALEHAGRRTYVGASYNLEVRVRVHAHRGLLRPGGVMRVLAIGQHADILGLERALIATTPKLENHYLTR